MLSASKLLCVMLRRFPAPCLEGGRSLMKSVLLAVLAAGAFVAATVTPPAPAQAASTGEVVAAGVGGFALGTMLGLSAPHPVYVAPAPVVVASPRRLPALWFTAATACAVRTSAPRAAIGHASPLPLIARDARLPGRSRTGSAGKLTRFEETAGLYAGRFVLDYRPVCAICSSTARVGQQSSFNPFAFW